jgi:hypothetical protein
MAGVYVDVGSLHTPEQLVISLVGADPEPVEIVAFPMGNRSVRAANVYCPDLALLLESERRVKRAYFLSA